MGCGCKKKKVSEPIKLDYTFDEVIEAVKLINGSITITPEEKDTLYNLHNRIYVKNKQLNVNCGDCFRIVKRNIIRYYERNK